MKKSKEEAERWLKQSEYDLESAKRNLRENIYSYTCFICEQASQKALKAYLIFKGERYVWEHSIQKLAEKCANYDTSIAKFKEYGAILDKYYLTTRYPDVLPPPAIPYESYTNKEAQEAIYLTKEIVKFMKSNIEGGGK